MALKALYFYQRSLHKIDQIIKSLKFDSFIIENIKKLYFSVYSAGTEPCYDVILRNITSNYVK
jgi:hypothetical protein